MAFLDGWTKAKSITIPAAYITGDLANFPLSIQFTDDADIGAAALANGYDIRFTLSDGITILPCYRRSFSVTGGLATGLFDVLIPSLTNGVEYSFLCQYSNPSAPDVSNSAAVFGAAGAGAVLMMPDPSDGLDISGNGNNGTPASVSQVTGQIGYAGSFSTGSVTRTLSQAQGAVSYATWVKMGGTVSTIQYLQGVQDSGNAGGRMIRWRGDVANNTIEFEAINDSGEAGVFDARGVVSSPTAWNRIVGVLNPSAGYLYLYINGVQQTPVAISGNWTTQLTNWTLGKRPDSASLYLAGSLDESLTVFSALSPAWASLDYIQVTSSVVLWGEEQTSTPILAFEKSFPLSFIKISHSEKTDIFNTALLFTYYICSFPIINFSPLSYTTLDQSQVLNYSVSKYIVGDFWEWELGSRTFIWSV